ncbi:MAG: hypothetical protein JXR78_05590, partial [Victivallales bacterium]|nr:hypothetical protein [Victivallales bacterium]
MPSEEELAQRQAEQATQDSIAAAQAQQQDSLLASEDSLDETGQANQTTPGPTTEQRGQTSISETQVSRNLGAFSQANYADTVLTIVRTEEFEIEMTNVGAGPSRITLLEHQTWDDNPVQMIRDVRRSAYSLGF